MKKVLIFLGGAFVFMVVCVAALATYFAVSDPGKGSQAFADSAVQAIVSNWDESQLLTRASPSLLNDIDTPYGKSLFPFFRSLGQMTKFDGSQGSWRSGFTASQGAVTTAEYTAKVEFGEKHAQVVTDLVKQNGQWKICGFKVVSPDLVFPAPTSSKS